MILLSTKKKNIIDSYWIMLNIFFFILQIYYTKSYVFYLQFFSSANAPIKSSQFKVPRKNILFNIQHLVSIFFFMFIVDDQ